MPHYSPRVDNSFIRISRLIMTEPISAPNGTRTRAKHSAAMVAHKQSNRKIPISRRQIRTVIINHATVPIIFFLLHSHAHTHTERTPTTTDTCINPVISQVLRWCCPFSLINALRNTRDEWNDGDDDINETKELAEVFHWSRRTMQ